MFSRKIKKQVATSKGPVKPVHSNLIPSPIFPVAPEPKNPKIEPKKYSTQKPLKPLPCSPPSSEAGPSTDRPVTIEGEDSSLSSGLTVIKRERKFSSSLRFRRSVSITVSEHPVARDDMSLTRDNMSVMSLTCDDISLTRDDMSLSGDNMSLTRDNMSLTRDDNDVTRLIRPTTRALPSNEQASSHASSRLPVRKTISPGEMIVSKGSYVKCSSIETLDHFKSNMDTGLNKKLFVPPENFNSHPALAPAPPAHAKTENASAQKGAHSLSRLSPRGLPHPDLCLVRLEPSRVLELNQSEFSGSYNGPVSSPVIQMCTPDRVDKKVKITYAF